MIPSGKAEGGWALLVALLATLLSFTTKKHFPQLLLEKPARESTPSLPKAMKYLKTPLIYAALFSLAWIFRSRNHFMGDGWYYVQEVGNNFKLMPDRLLDFFIHQLFFRVLSSAGNGDGELAYALLHCLLFPVFIWLSWNIAGLITGKTYERTLATVIIGSTTCLQLFAGYAECYTLINLSLAAYLYFGIKLLEENQAPANLWKPAGLFLVALLCHKSALVLGPSLLFMVLLFVLPSSGKTGMALTRASIVVAFVLLAGIIYRLSLPASDSYTTIPLFNAAVNEKIPFNLFDLPHLWEKFNFLLLICPLVLIAIPPAVAGIRKIWQEASPGLAFVIWSAAGSFAFFLLFNPLLGIRDWDLMSIMGMPLSVSCCWILFLVLDRGARAGNLLMALTLGLAFHTSLWIYTNADVDRGVRYLDRVRFEDPHTNTGKFNLSGLLKEKGYCQEAFNQLKLVTAKETDNKILRMGEFFLKFDMPDSLVTYYRKAYYGRVNVPEAASTIFIRLSLAFDMMSCPDSAHFYYVMIPKNQLTLSEEDAEWWRDNAKDVAKRYVARLNGNPADFDALLFILRYSSIYHDNNALDKLFYHVKNISLSLSQWKQLVEFAYYYGTEKQAENMLLAALKQYPEESCHLNETRN